MAKILAITNDSERVYVALLNNGAADGARSAPIVSSRNTSEGIAADPKYRPLLEAYVRNDTAQCGYCTPAQFTMAKYILNKYDFAPTEEQIRLELSGNICRCGTYARHVKAIMEAAAEMKGGR